MEPHDSLSVSIRAYGIPAVDLQQQLDRILAGVQDSPEWNIGTHPSRFRTVDPAILVAIVGASGAALGALVTGLLRIAQKKGTQKIVIQGRDGRRLEVPADTSTERIGELLQVVRGMDRPHIEL